MLDRDELAARCLVALLTRDDYNGEDAVRVAVVAADALLARLRPEAVSPAPSPAATPAAWVPKRGDVVALAETPFVSATDPRDSYGAHLYRVVRDKVGPDGCLECVRVDGRDTTSPCWISPGSMRPATSSERAAAGLPVDESAGDRAPIDALIEAVRWVLNDAAFKPPEQVGEVGERWVARLERAMDSLPPSLTKSVKP